MAAAAETDASDPLVGMVRTAAERLTRDGIVTGLNAITDARFLRHEVGISTVVFGPGSIEREAHIADESVSVDDVLDTAAVYRRTIERFFAA